MNTRTTSLVLLLTGACAGSPEPAEPTNPWGSTVFTDTVALSSGDTGTSAGELLVNGNAEACTLAGWTPSIPGTIAAVAKQDEGSGAPTVLPFEGGCFFSFAGGPLESTTHTLSQSGALPGGGLLRLRGWVRTRDFETAVATLVADGPSGELGRAQTAPLQVDDWTAFEVSLAAPDDTVEWTLHLAGDLESGSYTNVYFDSLSLVVMP